MHVQFLSRNQDVISSEKTSFRKVVLFDAIQYPPLSRNKSDHFCIVGFLPILVLNESNERDTDSHNITRNQFGMERDIVYRSLSPACNNISSTFSYLTHEWNVRYIVFKMHFTSIVKFIMPGWSPIIDYCSSINLAIINPCVATIGYCDDFWKP